MGSSMQKVCGTRTVVAGSLILMKKCTPAIKSTARELGLEARVLPGVHHRLIRGKAANFDLREQFIAHVMFSAIMLRLRSRVLFRAYVKIIYIGELQHSGHAQ